MQTIAVSGPSPSGERTLIVSEPPPHVTLEKLVAVDAARLSRNAIKQWTIGFDGWVKDVVFQLASTTEDELEALVAALSQYLYFTDYKHYALSLPIDLEALQTRYPVDLRVRTTDVETWYRNQRFCALGEVQLRELAKAPLGVYVSQDRGLVVWVVPKRGIDQPQGGWDGSSPWIPT